MRFLTPGLPIVFSVFVGTFEHGLKRSIDGGETFERVGADAIEPKAVTAVAVAPGDPELVSRSAARSIGATLGCQHQHP